MRSSRPSVVGACVAGLACAIAVFANAGGCFYDWGRPAIAVGDADVDAGKDAAIVKSDSGSDAAAEKDGAVRVDCTQAAPCPGGSYCSYDDHACGTGAKTGKCTTPPPCPKPDSTARYCGCDGTLRDSECATFAAGVDLSTSFGASPGATCKIDTGKLFACGYVFCARDSEYCVATGNAYKCQSTAGCAKADCGCAQQATKCAKCSDDTAGGVTVSCP